MMINKDKTANPSTQNQKLNGIAPLCLEDCGSVAIIHMSAFPNSSLTKLGIEAVKRYYAVQMNPLNDCIAVGLYEHGQLLGYIYAGIFHGMLANFIRANRWFLVWNVLSHPWLVFNPKFRDAIKLGLRTLKRKKASVKSSIANRDYVVLAIAVDSKVQQQGIGQVLMDYAKNQAVERGFQRMVLTVNSNNMKALRFYEKDGWKIARRYSGPEVEMTKQL